MSRPRTRMSGFGMVRRGVVSSGSGRAGVVRGLAAGTVALLVVGGGGALSAQAAPSDPSQALGQFLGADLLQLQAADLAYAYA